MGCSERNGKAATDGRYGSETRGIRDADFVCGIYLAGREKDGSCYDGTRKSVIEISFCESQMLIGSFLGEAIIESLTKR
jgi:hypothetical protein